MYLSDSVVTTRVVVGGIFLSSDHLLGMEKLLVSAGADLICEDESIRNRR